MDITIVRNKKTGKFHLVEDESEALLPGHTYDTFAEAKDRAEEIVSGEGKSRIPQLYIDRLLLSDDDDTKAFGRLLASEAWPAVEAWLDAERQDTAEDAARLLHTWARFTAVVLAGIAHEHWPDIAEINETILRLVAHSFGKMRRG
jgi:hypothetical protein